MTDFAPADRAPSPSAADDEGGRYVVGVDLGGTKISVGVVTDGGREVAVRTGLTRAELGADAVVEADTDGSAQLVAEWDRREDAAVASSLAAEIYGLDVLRANVEDAAHNTTRFIVLAKEPSPAPAGDGKVLTSFVFRVRNLPAALYKALGGFATNRVNMTKLESYMVDGEFTATQFLADVDGHPADAPLRRALEELEYFSRELRVLGTYAAHPFRTERHAAG